MVFVSTRVHIIVIEVILTPLIALDMIKLQNTHNFWFLLLIVLILTMISCKFLIQYLKVVLILLKEIIFFILIKLITKGCLEDGEFGHKLNSVNHILQHGFTVIFTAIFGDSFPSTSYLEYQINSNSPIQIYKSTSNKTIEYRERTPQTSLTISVECVGSTNNVQNAYCAISDYYIVVHYCNPNCGSCTDADVCDVDVCDVDKPICLTNQFYDEFSRQCYDCPHGCLTCLNYDNCISCETNFLLFGMRCILNCLLDNYNYYDGTQCQRCPKVCKTCLNENLCLSCDLAAARYLENGQCLCQTGFYDEISTSTCKLCYQSCQTCFGPTNTECYSCLNMQNLSLQSQSCMCSVGYYFDEFFHFCNKCNQKCLTCFYQTQKSCLSCDIALNRILQGIQCKCQFGYYEMDNSLICEQCPTIEDINLQQCYHSCDEWITQQWFNINCNTCLTNYQLINSQYCEPICGDSLIVGYEQCDDTSQYCLNCQMKCPQNQLDCNIQSTFNDVCGDGYITSEEECDDGNTINYDGCSNCKLDCQAECTLCIRGICYECYTTGWQLNEKTYSCTEKIGDNYLVGNETCYYVHQRNCYQGRIIFPETLTTCSGSPCYSCKKGYEPLSNQSYCTPICGDGIVVPGEECDDGNLTDYDGCSSLCLWQCQPLNFCKSCRYNKCIECQYGYTLNSITNKCDIINLCNDNNSLMNDGCYNNFIQCQTSCKSCTLNGCVLCNKGYKLNLSNNQCDPICGDKIIVKEEDCDDGNLVPYDGCYLCQFNCPFTCENCVKGRCIKYQIVLNQNPNVSVTYIIMHQYKQEFPQLKFISHCKIVLGEQCLFCDNGFFLQKFGGQCQSICGDGIQTELEQCDFGNSLLDTGCNNCQFKCTDSCLNCQNGLCLQCMSGYALPYDQSQIQQCRKIPDCDFYPGLYLNSTSNLCESICGDGIRSLDEDCDNAQSGLTYMCDNCKCCATYECQSVVDFNCGEGYYFNNETRVCDSRCGDGITVIEEQCDDGNDVNDDLCTNDCVSLCDPNCSMCALNSNNTIGCLSCVKNYNLIDSMYCELIVIDNVLNIIACNDGYILNSQKICVTVCGDGIIAGDEECDDGNLINNDGCESNCISSLNTICSQNICTTVYYPMIQLVLIKENKNYQYVQLSIDQQMKFSSNTYTIPSFLNTIDISLVNAEDNQYDISISSDNQISSELSTISLTIEIKYYDPISKPTLSVYFTQQDYIKNNYQLYIQTPQVELILNDPNVLTLNNNKQQNIQFQFHHMLFMFQLVLLGYPFFQDILKLHLIQLINCNYFIVSNTQIHQLVRIQK